MTKRQSFGVSCPLHDEWYRHLRCRLMYQDKDAQRVRWNMKNLRSRIGEQIFARKKKKRRNETKKEKGKRKEKNKGEGKEGKKQRKKREQKQRKNKEKAYCRHFRQDQQSLHPSPMSLSETPLYHWKPPALRQGDSSATRTTTDRGPINLCS